MAVQMRAVVRHALFFSAFYLLDREIVMTITVKQLIKKLQKLDPNRCVYVESDDYHYLELDEWGEVVDQDGIAVIKPQYYYEDEQGNMI